MYERNAKGDYYTQPAKISVLKCAPTFPFELKQSRKMDLKSDSKTSAWIEVKIREGRNRQVSKLTVNEYVLIIITL